MLFQHARDAFCTAIRARSISTWLTSVRNAEVVVCTRSPKVSTSGTTAHYETLAIKHATQKLGRRTIPDCVFYCTCEPCPMCCRPERYR